jgi:hypothetical protein
MAASLALLWYFATTPDPIRTRAARLAIYGPLAFWGVLTYSAYQFIAFDEPLAFTQTQSHWTFHSPPTPTNWADRAIALATLEPARGVYDPSSSRHWRHMDIVDTAISSLGFWNPLLFGLAGGCIAFGWAKRWLTGPEVVYGAVSLLVPYVTRSYDMSMASHGRFAAAVIPMYLVIGKILSRLPAAMSNAIIFCLGGVLIYWTALYVAGYNFF